MGTPLRERDRRGRWRGRGRAGRSRPCSPAWPTRWSPATSSTCRVSYEGMEAIGTGLGACGFIVYDDTHRPGRGGPGGVALPLRRVVRPVPGMQARDRRHHRPSSTPCWTGVATTTTIELIGARLRTRHRRQPLLPRRSRSSGWWPASCGRSRRSFVAAAARVQRPGVEASVAEARRRRRRRAVYRRAPIARNDRTGPTRSERAVNRT